jgi:lysophospholipase L1-like esterase
LHAGFKLIQTGWSIVGISLLLLLAVDRAAKWMLERGSFQYSQKRLAELQPAGDRAWIEAFVAERGDTEFTSSAVRWEPFAYWRSAEHRGQFFNVDAAGLRRTVNPAPPADAKSVRRVFLFGGSAMWGDSVRDEHTIPSLLAQRLRQQDYAVEVTNFAQLGYVSTQEWIALALELRRGNVPDLVIFFDGANDVGAAAANYRPGVSINEVNRQLEFNLLNDASWGRLFKSCAYNSAIGRLVRGGRGPEWADRQRDEMAMRNDERIAQQSAALQTLPANVTPEQRRQAEKDLRDLEIGREAVAVYRANLRIVQALQKAAGFETLFLWQPTVLDRTQPSVEETAIIGVNAKLGRIWSAAMRTWADIKAAEAKSPPVNPLPETVLLADVFDRPELAGKSMFFDLVHPSESANAIVAERIEPLVRAALDRRGAGDESGQ